MDSVVNLQPSFILHSKPYRERERIIELFTPDFGRSCVTYDSQKLVHRGSKSVLGKLQSFSPFLISWRGEKELKILTQAESVGAPISLSGDSLICGMYLNELLYRLAPRSDPQPVLFAIYSATLEQLALADDIEPVLRRFEMQLLLEIGYGVNFECEQSTGKPILPNVWYQYKVQSGFIEVAKPPSRRMLGVFPGELILSIALEDFSTNESRKVAKWIMRRAITHLLGDQPLNSRKLFS